MKRKQNEMTTAAKHMENNYSTMRTHSMWQYIIIIVCVCVCVVFIDEPAKQIFSLQARKMEKHFTLCHINLIHLIDDCII